MTTNTAIAKLRSALTCHPNAVRPLIEEAISALESAPALDAQGEAPTMPQYWSVEVMADSETLVSIGNDWLSGTRPLEEGDEQTILGAAKHLLSFIGYGLPVSTFDPDESSPPHPAVGKPLSEDACNDVMDEARRLHRKFTSGVRGQMLTINDSADYWLIRATEAAHGIVTKEIGNG